MSQPITTASRVTLHFTLRLEGGDVIDTTLNRAEPVTFAVGDGSLLPGFERKLLGLQSGERAQFTVLPEEAFGQPNPGNVQRFARKLFEDTELKEGLILSFADAQKTELPGVISRFDDDEVVVDFNHPLAGRTILFDVEIVDVTPAAD
jgi:FKBP-type peptidyl-prolyl cis-trans isomerase SlpA